MTFNTDDGDLRTFSNLDGFAETEVAVIRHAVEYDALFVAYENANINILKGEDLVEMPEIKNKTIIGEKRVNDVYFINELAYLSCSFGIVVIDMEAEEVKDTYFIGPEGSAINVNNLVADDQYFYAATELGLYKADLNDPILINFNNWELQDESNGLVEGIVNYVSIFNNAALCSVSGSLYEHDGNNWNLRYSADEDFGIVHMNNRGNELILTENRTGESSGSRIVLLEEFALKNIFESNRIPRCQETAVSSNGSIWVSDNYHGMVEIKGENIGYPVQASGPRTKEAFSISLNGEQEFWISPLRISRAWTPKADNTGVYHFDGNSWEQFSFLNDNGQVVKDIFEVEISPNESTVYIASFSGGVIEKTEDAYIVYDNGNSLISNTVGDPNSYRIAGISLDEDQNLWMCNYGALNPIVVKTVDGQWNTFSPPLTKDRLGRIEIDRFGFKWFVARNEGILVMDSGEDPLSPIDDQYRVFKNIDFNFGIPSNEVNCLAADLEDEIWVGTEDGVAVFFCTSDPFNTDCDFSKPVIFDENGENPVYLLEGSVINSITVDPADRKWLGTNNGVLLLSPDGKETILNFTEENSPLLSNLVKDVQVNSQTGEVFMATERGVISYQGDALEAEFFHEDVLVYPNPVRPDFTGNIAIRGLANGAFVKITDATGRLVHETESLGGQAVWDGFNYNGERANTGVYIVLSSNEDGTETYHTKFLIVN